MLILRIRPMNIQDIFQQFWSLVYNNDILKCKSQTTFWKCAPKYCNRGLITAIHNSFMLSSMNSSYSFPFLFYLTGLFYNVLELTFIEFNLRKQYNINFSYKVSRIYIKYFQLLSYLSQQWMNAKLFCQTEEVQKFKVRQLLNQFLFHHISRFIYAQTLKKCQELYQKTSLNITCTMQKAFEKSIENQEGGFIGHKEAILHQICKRLQNLLQARCSL